MCNEELNGIKDMFNTLDVNKDGYLTVDELKEGLKDVEMFQINDGPEENEDEDLFSNLDINRDGRIDFSEFSQACINRKSILNAKNIKVAYDMIDEDGNGKITVSELKEFLHQSDIQAGVIMDELDENKDGVISFEEFNDKLTQKYFQPIE